MTKILPQQPNLEHLRCQAKELLEAQKKGEPAVCPTLRLLNRFANSTDAEILSATLTLHEAQFALALDYGFSSWNALKQHVEQLARLIEIENTMPSDKSVILQGVDHYRVTDPLFEGIRVILSYRGEPYTPAYIQGIAGSAFRISGKCASGPTCCHAMHTEDLIHLLGYQSEYLSLSVEGVDPKVRVYEVLNRIKAEIRAGRPVLLWHAFTSAEWDVVCGFDETEEQLFGRGSHVGLGDYASAVETRTLTSEPICGLFGATVIGEKTGTLDAHAAERAALEEAVRHAHSQAGVDLLPTQPDVHLVGLACYERWHREFSTDPDRRRQLGDTYNLQVYRSTHRAASGFLMEISNAWPKASPHLLRASEQFLLEAKALDRCWPLLEWTTPAGPDPERNIKVGALLKTAAEHYGRGIQEIENALSVMR